MLRAQLQDIPSAFLRVVIQMFLISSALASQEICSFLKGKAVTEADQQQGYATDCGITFKCPTNFNLSNLTLKAV